MSNIGYIYKLYDNTNGDVYYGSTTKTVGARIYQHKYQTKKSQNKCKSSSIILNGDYSYNVEEKVMYDEKWELLKRERWYIENNECINKCIPNKFIDNPNYYKEYRGANRDKLLDYEKDYREANKDKIIDKNKAYYEANKDKILDKNKAYYEVNKDKSKAYYEANKDKIKAYQKEYRERRRQNKPEPETNMIINEMELLNE